MPRNDVWDWPLLLYVATVILNMSEAKFWKTTPRKFKALYDVHIRLNVRKQKDNASKPGYIDQVM